MSLVELLPDIRSLPRRDKLRLVQLLVGEFAQEEENPLAGMSALEVWTPLDAHDAAATLLDALRGEPSS